MPVVDRKYAGAAAKATLQTAMTPTAPGGGGTITVSDDSGYPTTGKFEIKIDRGENNEESILIASRSGTTFTISSRGYDGTVANAHTSGQSFVEHYLSAQSTQLFTDHVDDVEAAPHAAKLPVGTTAGHDVEARHTFGAALGSPVTPTSVGTAAAVGTGNNPSKEDHAHDLAVGSIDAANLFAAGVVDAAAIATGAVGSAELGTDSVIAGKIADGAIDAAALFVAGVVDAAAIATNAVGSAELADNAVDTNAIANDAVTFAKINESGFPATTDDVVVTSQGTTSTTFTDLATVGPDVVMTPPASGKVKVSIYSSYVNSGIGGNLMSFALSGGNTLAASDDRSIGNTGSNSDRGGATFLLTGLAVSSTTFRAKYRTGSGTGTFSDRRLIVEPVLA